MPALPVTYGNVKKSLPGHVKNSLPYYVKNCLPNNVKNSLPYSVKIFLPNDVKKCLTFAQRTAVSFQNDLIPLAGADRKRLFIHSGPPRML